MGKDYNMKEIFFNLLFPQYASRLDSSEARIRDLERSLEIITGANSILVQQLEKSQMNEEKLREKIFEMTGISRGTAKPQTSAASLNPINMGKRIEWAKLKEDLETKARSEYWEEKKRKAEEIDKLEKEVLSSERTK